MTNADDTVSHLPHDPESIIEEEPDTYNFREILDALVEHKDLILTIPDDQVEALKKGLSVVKAKNNAKLKSAGLVAPTDAITYTVYKADEDKETENTKIRIRLGPRTAITVLKMEIPDDSI